MRDSSTATISSRRRNPESRSVTSEPAMFSSSLRYCSSCGRVAGGTWTRAIWLSRARNTKPPPPRDIDSITPMSWITNSGRCTPMRDSEFAHAAARTIAIGVSTWTCESAIVAACRAT